MTNSSLQTKRCNGFSNSTTVNAILGTTQIEQFTTSATGELNNVIVSIPSTQPPGGYFIDIINDTNSAFLASAVIEVIDDANSFSVISSTDFIDPFEQGTTSDPVSFTVDVFNGESLENDQVTIQVFGLPSGVSATFDGVAATVTNGIPTKILNISDGGVQTINMQFSADTTALPNQLVLFINAVTDEGGANEEEHGVGILSSIFAPVFSDADIPGETNFFTVGTVFLNPDVFDAGDQVALSASGLDSNSAITISIFGPPNATANPTPFNATGLLVSSATQGTCILCIPDTTTDSSGNVFIPTINMPTNLPAGTFDMKVTTVGGREALTSFTVSGSSDVFTFSSSPEFNPAFEQGKTSDPFVLTVSALPGKTPGDVTITLFGVTRGVTANFDGVAATLVNGLPTKTLNVGLGETVSTSLTYTASASVLPGPIIVDAEADEAGAQNPIIAFVDSEITLPAALFNVGEIGGIDLYNFATLSVMPSSAAPGESVTIIASGFAGSPTIGTNNCSDTIESCINFGEIGISIPSTQNTLSGGSFSKTITVPSTLAAGFYAVEMCVDDVVEVGEVSQCAVTEFQVLDSGDTTKMDFKPTTFMAPFEQGMTLAESPEFTITLSATSSNVDPPSTVVTLFGLPSFIQASMKGPDDTSFTETNSKTVNLGVGETANIALKFVVDSGAPPIFLPLFLEANVGSGTQFVGIPVDGSIKPSETGAEAFNVGQVSISPAAAEVGDQITLVGSGFNPSDSLTITFGTFEISDAANNLPDPLDNTQTDGSFSIQLLVPGSTQGLTGAGTYPVTIKDTGKGTSTDVRSATTEFQLLATGDTFTFNTSQEFVSPIPTGSTSEDIILNVQALPNKIPGPDISPVDGINDGTATITVFGLPTAMTANFVGLTTTSDSDGNPTATLSGITSGSLKTATLQLTAGANTPPGNYLITIRADDTILTEFTHIEVPVLPGGDAFNDFAILSVTPSFGAAGDVVQISANGFTIGADVALNFGGVNVLAGKTTIPTFGSTSVSGSGGYGTSLNVPTLDPGFYTITISDGTNKTSGEPKLANVPFEVVGAGEIITLTSTPDFQSTTAGKSPGPEYEITLQAKAGQDPPLTSISIVRAPPFSTVNLGGSVAGFNAFGEPTINLDPGLGVSNMTTLEVVTSPATPPGTYTMFVVAEFADPDGAGPLTNGFTEIPLTISVVPDAGVGTKVSNLIVNPSSVPAGGDISLIGGGFTQNSQVAQFAFQIPGSPTAKVIPLGDNVFNIDTNGDFSAYLTIPFNATEGEYDLIATDESNVTARVSFVILPNFISTTGFFDILIEPDSHTIVQEGNVTTSRLTMTSYSQFVDLLKLDVSELPPGMSLVMKNSTGAELATFNGTTSGNNVTKAGASAGNPTMSTTGNGGDVIYKPGGTGVVTLELFASTSTPLGSYIVNVDVENGFSSSQSLFIDVIATAGDPTITLSPSNGPKDSVVTVTGKGFTVDGTITLTFNDLPSDDASGFVVRPTVITVVTNPDDPSTTNGIFNAEITIPDPSLLTAITTVTGGQFPVKAIDSAATPRSAEKPFNILPQLTEATFKYTISPPTVLFSNGTTAKQTLTVEPIGFFPSNITFSIAGLPTNVTATFDPPVDNSTTPLNMPSDDASGFVVRPTVITVVTNPDDPSTTNGIFNAEITIPDPSLLTAITTVTGGQFPVKAIDSAATPRSAEKPFNILPQLTEATFKYTISPPTVLFSNGTTAKQTLTVEPIGFFPSNITFSIAGLPTNVTATFDPPVDNSTTPLNLKIGTTSTITLNLNHGGDDAALGANTYTSYCNYRIFWTVRR